MKFFYLLITLILTPLIVGASEDSTIKELGVYDTPHPGGNLDYKSSFSFRGKIGIFLFHQCLEGREIVSVQDIPKNPKKKVLIKGGEGLQNANGNSISCEQKNWFVLGVTRLEKINGNSAFRAKLFCVRNNLIRVRGNLTVENWGVSSVASRCSSG